MSIIDIVTDKFFEYLKVNRERLEFQWERVFFVTGIINDIYYNVQTVRFKKTVCIGYDFFNKDLESIFDIIIDELNEEHKGYTILIYKLPIFFGTNENGFIHELLIRKTISPSSYC